MHKKTVFDKVEAIVLGNVREEKDREKLRITDKHRTKRTARIFEALLDKIYLDPDTGLPNYQSFTHDLLDLILERQAKKEHNRTDRVVHAQPHKEEQPPDTVIFMDINHFKEFNTHLGMQATDSLIRAVADVIKEHLRTHPGKKHAVEHHRSSDSGKPDMLARAKKGGDEFLILLRGCSKEDAKRWCKTMLEAIKNKIFVVNHKDSTLGEKCIVKDISLAYGYYEIDSRLRDKDGRLYDPSTKPIDPDGEQYDTPHSAIDKAEALMRTRKNRMKEDGRAPKPQIITCKRGTGDSAELPVDRLMVEAAISELGKNNDYVGVSSPKQVSV